MTTRRDLLAGLAITPLLFASRGGQAAETTETKPEFLFVQSAEGMRFADGRLTLTGMSPVTILFSDRPERLAGHMATRDFVATWGKGDNSFESDPPNADLSILEGGSGDNVVLTLHQPRLEGQDLSYDVEVLEGKLPARGGLVSLFIDIIGRPLTPISFAGANRRMWRRRALY
jgi:hypothetical protein